MYCTCDRQVVAYAYCIIFGASISLVYVTGSNGYISLWRPQHVKLKGDTLQNYQKTIEW